MNCQYAYESSSTNFITSTVPAEDWLPVATVVVKAEPPLVMVVVTVSADGEAYMIVPLVLPVAETVLVYAVRPCEIHVVDVTVPSGT